MLSGFPYFDVRHDPLTHELQIPPHFLLRVRPRTGTGKFSPSLPLPCIRAMRAQLFLPAGSKSRTPSPQVPAIRRP
jgi:hypothetical protein